MRRNLGGPWALGPSNGTAISESNACPSRDPARTRLEPRFPAVLITGSQLNFLTGWHQTQREAAFSSISLSGFSIISQFPSLRANHANRRRFHDLSGITMNDKSNTRPALPFAFVAIQEKRGCIRNSTYVVGTLHGMPIKARFTVQSREIAKRKCFDLKEGSPESLKVRCRRKWDWTREDRRCRRTSDFLLYTSSRLLFPSQTTRSPRELRDKRTRKWPFCG